MGVALMSAWLSASVAVAAAPVGESARITNFDRHVTGDTRGPYGAPAVVVDMDGNAVDAHDGRLRYFAGRYYWYGTAYRCGYALWDLDGTRPVQPGRHTFCGIAAYSSSDLMTWRDEGLLFDPSTSDWQAACGTGCFSPLVLFDPRRNRYVLWVNALNGDVNYRVLTSASPTGPFTDVKVPSLDMPQEGGDYDILVDHDGTGWLAETVRRGILIQQLSSDYTDGVGSSVVAVPSTFPAPPDLWCVGQTFCGLREGPSLFRRGDFYYLVLSDPACPYCQGGTSYYMAKRPVGPWNGPGLLSVSTPIGATGLQQGELISFDSCGGQPRSVSKLPTSAGSVYVYWSDLWRGITRQVSPGGPFPSHASDSNQSLAGRFWAPLRFRGDGTIQRIDCTAVAEVPLAEGHVASSTPTAYQTACVIGGGQSVRQELRPLAQPISGVRVTVYKHADPDASLSYEISGTSGGPLPSESRGELSPESVSSAPRTVVLPISAEANASLTVTLRSSTQRGCYGVLLAHASEPDAGTYEGAVAGTPTSTRAVGILATPIKRSR
ncbi:MAG TPA: family 43 glycosylhydrolase [Solirubrobacteraceae bacterium]